MEIELVDSANSSKAIRRAAEEPFLRNRRVMKAQWPFAKRDSLFVAKLFHNTQADSAQHASSRRRNDLSIQNQQ
jgi:hypothetical protein